MAFGMQRALTGPDGTPMRVLVVDDNPINRRVVVATLAKLGCRVDVAVDGAGAIAMCARTRYHSVLIDSELSGMDGFAATRAIRAAEPEGRRAHIVAVAAHSTPIDRERAIDAGMDDYATKPIGVDDLAALLRQGTPEPSSYSLVPPIELAVISDADLFDHVQQFLQEMMEIDEDVSDIIVEFIQQGRERLAELESAVGRDDPATVHTAAHALKGSLSYLGVGEITAMCRTLEKRGMRNQLEDVSDVVDQISAALARIDSARLARDPQRTP